MAEAVADPRRRVAEEGWLGKQLTAAAIREGISEASVSDHFISITDSFGLLVGI